MFIIISMIHGTIRTDKSNRAYFLILPICRCRTSKFLFVTIYIYLFIIRFSDRRSMDHNVISHSFSPLTASFFSMHALASYQCIPFYSNWVSKTLYQSHFQSFPIKLNTFISSPEQTKYKCLIHACPFLSRDPPCLYSPSFLKSLLDNSFMSEIFYQYHHLIWY